MYLTQRLFLAPHISGPIDSSDSRQDNNRTSLSHSITTIITDLPGERAVGGEDRGSGGEEGVKGRGRKRGVREGVREGGRVRNERGT